MVPESLQPRAETQQNARIRLLAVGLVIACLLPAVLMAVGVDFGTTCGPDEVARAQSHVRGSYTHTLLEWSAVCAAAFVAILAFSQYRMTNEPSLPVIGMAMLGAGCMDAFHTLAADGLIRPGVENERFIPFTWALCRLYNALVLAFGVGMFAFRRSDNDRNEHQPQMWLIVAAFSIPAWFAIQLSVAAGSLPVTQFPDAVIKRPYDLLALLPLLACGLVIIPRYLRRHPTVFSIALLLSIIPQAATQLYMAFGSDALHDSAFNIGHAMKVVGYTIPLIGLILQHNRTFDELVTTREELSGAVLKVWQNDHRRQQAVAALQRSEERLELATLGSNDGLWDWDISTNRVHYSLRFKELLGYSDADFPNVYESWESALHPDDKKSTLDSLQQHLENGTPYDVECRLKNSDGNYRWFRTRGRAVREADGKPFRMAGSLTDIHAQKEVEEALRLSEERFQLAVLGSNDGIWDWPDMTRDEEWWSPRFYDLLGYNFNEIPASYSTFLGLLHPDDRDNTLRRAEAHLKGEAPFDVEYRLRAKSGEYRWFQARGQIVRDPVGDRHRMAGSITDIANRKENEKALRMAKENAEAATQAKADFLANMSHEIRTPLNGVIGMTELLWETELSLGQMELVNDIRSSADSLLKIINNILDISKIEAGRLELEETGFDLIATIEDTVRPLQYHTQDTAVRLGWTVDDDVPRFIVGDPVRLRQVLLNLIGNAVKFTESGSVDVRVSTVTSASEPLLQFEVADTGIGIPPEKQREIFERFQQVDSSTTREYGGTGLGLAITAELVRLMGGAIRVHSIPRNGSTFTFNVALKVCEDDDPVTRESRAGSPFARGERQALRVLLVDDTRLNRKYGSHVLRLAGHTVTLANNGLEAIEQVRQSEFDVVLMDIQMPGIDGYETTARIRSWQQENDRHFPIIAMTAHAMPDVKDKCLASGMDGYISKPVKPRQLLETIDSILGVRPMNGTNATLTHEPQAAIPPGMAAALNNVDGDVEFLRDLAEIYDEQAPELLEAIDAAIRSGDWESLERNAHSLKGASGTLGSQSAFDVALTLERAGRDRQADGLDELLAALQDDVNDLQQSLRDFLAEPTGV